jgi:hypothetical protein
LDFTDVALKILASGQNIDYSLSDVDNAGNVCISNACDTGEACIIGRNDAG